MYDGAIMTDVAAIISISNKKLKNYSRRQKQNGKLLPEFSQRFWHNGVLLCAYFHDFCKKLFVRTPSGRLLCTCIPMSQCVSFLILLDTLASKLNHESYKGLNLITSAPTTLPTILHRFCIYFGSGHKCRTSSRTKGLILHYDDCSINGI